MNLGFIGTGAITEAMISGWLGAEAPISQFHISRRNIGISTRLAALSDRVHVHDDNQHIAEICDTAILAVRPQVAKEVLQGLRFAEDTTLISIIASVTSELLRKWTGHTGELVRAIPLPAIAQRACVTAIFPPSEKPAALFRLTGGVVETQSIDAFNSYAVASATMGTYFGLTERIVQWMCDEGTSAKEARNYIASLFCALSNTAARENTRSLEDLRLDHTTPGGLNHRVFETFCNLGGHTALSQALEETKMIVRNASLAE